MVDETLEVLIRKAFPFDSFRQGQIENIHSIITALTDGNKDNYIFEAPTGTGKSVIAYTAGKVLDEKTTLCKVTKGEMTITSPRIIICTSTKQLQNQYIESFKSCGAEHLWSAKNYDCAYYPPEDGVYYGSGACMRKKCKDYNICEYVLQKKKFTRASIGICNYHYILNSTEFNPNIFIMDEAHNLPKILCDIASLKLSEFSFNRIAKMVNDLAIQVNIFPDDFILPLKVLMKDNPDNIEKHSLRPFCEAMLRDFNGFHEELLEESKVFSEQRNDILDSHGMVPIELDKTIVRFNQVLDGMNYFIQKFENYLESKTDWIVSDMDMNKTSITIKPLEVTDNMKALEKRCNKMIFLSATICGPMQYAVELGLDINKIAYSQTICPFPVENRRIFTTNVGSLNYKNKHEMLPLFINKIDYLIDYMTQGWKVPLNGIIHSVSYQNAEIIQQRSKHKEKIYIPKGEDMMDLNKIIRSYKNGVVIISPSILEGVDLVDDLSRFQIFLKVPYGDLKDRWIKTKLQHNEKWYARESIIKIVQGCGRSIRSKDDWAWTFILDSNFNRLRQFNGEMFPNWFLEAITDTTL